MRAVKVVAAVSAAVLAGSACGGTLEDDYRRGKLPSRRTPATQDNDEVSGRPGANMVKVVSRGVIPG